MRALVVGHPRSRTTPLICALSYHYKINNFNEVYDHCRAYSLSEKTTIAQSSNQSLKELEIFKRKVSILTDQLFGKSSLVIEGRSKFEKSVNSMAKFLSHNPSFVVKIFPRYFTASQYIKNQESVVLNITEYFNITAYDKIYLTQRHNCVDALASWHLGKLYGNHTFYLPEHIEIFERNLRVLKKNTVISLTEEYKTFLIEVFLIEKISQYLDKNNLSYEDLEYNNIPAYINNNFPSENTADFLKNNAQLALWSMPIELNFDYKSIIANYSEVQNMIDQFRQESQLLIDSINFV